MLKDRLRPLQRTDIVRKRHRRHVAAAGRIVLTRSPLPDIRNVGKPDERAAACYSLD